MASEIIMPRQGQSVESCIINQWTVKEGDRVNIGDIVCEVETDKATFEVESTANGTVLSLLYPSDADVEVLKPIALIGEPGEDISKWHTNIEPKKDEPISEHSIEKNSTTAINPTVNIPKNNHIGISPRAKKIAQEKNISISSLSGSGPAGRIIAKDVMAAESTLPDSLGESVITEAKGIRKIVAERMLNSLQDSAQLTLHASADARTLLKLRQLCKDSIEENKHKNISINDMIIYCVVQTLKTFPQMNAHWINNSIIEYNNIHIGFAVDTPRGLMVPVIKNAQESSLLEISKQAKELAAACQNGAIDPDLLTGATFTITNLGSMGIESFTPVLNLPEVAILGICSISPKPVMNGNEVTFIPHMGLSLTFNHCALDGAPAAKFLSVLKNNLYEVESLLTKNIF